MMPEQGGQHTCLSFIWGGMAVMPQPGGQHAAVMPQQGGQHAAALGDCDMTI